MSPLLMKMLARVTQAPAADDGSVVDRGDAYVPPEDPAPAPAPAPAPEPEVDPAAAADDEAKSDEDKAAGKKDSRIPLARHTAILEREREQRATLEARLAQYEKGSQLATMNEDLTKAEDSVVKMEKEYNKLLADGELEKASEMMSKIRIAERSINEAKSEVKLQAGIALATERARYNITLERVEESYAELNPDHPDFDRDKLNEVVEWKAFFETQRSATPSKALQEAVRRVMGKPTTTAEKQAVETKARVADKDVAAERKKEAVSKTMDATKKTPPNVKDIGMDSNKAGGDLSAKDVAQMTQDDFKKLPDDILSRMRGDTL